MGKVMVELSMSLDGFNAGPNDSVERLFKWYLSGDTDYRMPSGRMTLKVSSVSAKLLQELHRTTGALVIGRRTFDNANGWGGKHPIDVPIFVVTHTVPQEWVKEGSPFTFVTDGVESAVEQARAVAAEKNVGVGAASIAQQRIKAGLLDEIHIDLVPVLLGKGIRLFEHLGTEPVELESTKVIEAPGVTHLTFRVVG